MFEAWNRRDADAFADLFTATGSLVGFDGSEMNGRVDIASEFRAIFANHATATYIAKVREVRALSPQVALVSAVVGMIPPGKTELNPAGNAIQSVLVVAETSGLKICLLQETPTAFQGRPALGEALTRELSEVGRAGRIVQAG